MARTQQDIDAERDALRARRASAVSRASVSADGSRSVEYDLSSIDGALAALDREESALTETPRIRRVLPIVDRGLGW